VRGCLVTLLLLILCSGCTPNHSITLEPTIEEPAGPAALIETGDLKTAPQLK